MSHLPRGPLDAESCRKSKRARRRSDLSNWRAETRRDPAGEVQPASSAEIVTEGSYPPAFASRVCVTTCRETRRQERAVAVPIGYARPRDPPPPTRLLLRKHLTHVDLAAMRDVMSPAPRAR